MAEISTQELDGIYAFAVELGKQAGKMLMDAAQVRIRGASASARDEGKVVVQKENAVDLVTETDESTFKPWWWDVGNAGGEREVLFVRMLMFV